MRPARRPVVFLHIGEPKCGTTYLQEVARRNRDVLRRHGVVVAGNRQADLFRASQDLRDAPSPIGGTNAAWRGSWELLASQARHTPHATLISQEHLCGATAEQAARAIRSFGDAEVHVIVTIRDFVSLLPAEWQETVKHRNDRPWLAWLAGVRRSEDADGDGSRTRWFWQAHDTMAVLRRWTAELPARQVHVITVPRSRTQPTLLWERFAGVLGVDPSVADTDGVRSNATLGVVETELLRRLNQRLPADVPQWYYAQRVKGVVAHRLLAARPAGPRPQLPPEHLGWACARAERVINELAATEFEIVGDLDELRPAPTPVEVPQASDGEVLDAALDVLAGLLRPPAAHLPVRRLSGRYAAALRARRWNRLLVGRRAGS